MATKKIAYLLCSVLLLTACAVEGSSQVAVEATATKSPTEPPIYSTTVPPTPTALPPEPPPEELIIALRDYELISQDLEPALDDYHHHNATEVDGNIEIVGDGWAVSKFTLEPSQAALVQFSFEDDDNWEWDFVIDLRSNNEFGSDEYYSLGFNGDNEIFTVAEGEYLPGEPFDGSLKLSPYDQYYALLTLDPGGNFLIYVWDEDDRYSQVSSLILGDEWLNKEWLLNIWAGKGKVIVDRIDIYSFAEINILENESNWAGDWWFSGFGPDGYKVQLTQNGNEVEGAALGGFVDGRDFYIEGTAFKYDDPAGGYYDVFRGMYSIESEDHPGTFGIIWADWIMLDNGYQICGRGHMGATVQSLVRSGYLEYPSYEICSEWYYYEKDYFISDVEESLEWPIYEKGTEGTEVVVLQLLLHNLDYEITVDGDFGPGTEAVVKTFQADNNLDGDGIVGSDTWLTLTNKNLLSIGDQGDHVSALQIILSEKFGYEITVDSDFGPYTEGIVETFQAEYEIEVDGVVRIDTWHTLITDEGVGTSSQEESGEEPVSFIIDNQSNIDLCYLYISPSEDYGWGENWIDENAPLISGNQLSIDAPSGKHSLLAEDCDHVRLAEMSYTFGEDYTWEITPPGFAHIIAVVNTFEDNFTKNFSDWNFFSLDGSDVNADISDGYLNISTNGFNAKTYGMLARSEFPPAYQDINIFSKAEIDDPHAVTGFVCRASEAGWYEILYTSHDGYWVVIKKDAVGNFTELGTGFLDSIKGETSLDFKLVCADGMIELKVNDYSTTTVFDTSFDTGAVGVVGATDSGDTVHFEEFFVIWVGGM